MNDNPADFKPQVVVCSIINPNEPVTAVLFWSKLYTERGDFKQVVNFDAELYEDDTKWHTHILIVYKMGEKYKAMMLIPILPSFFEILI